MFPLIDQAGSNLVEVELVVSSRAIGRGVLAGEVTFERGGGGVTPLSSVPLGHRFSGPMLPAAVTGWTTADAAGPKFLATHNFLHTNTYKSADARSLGQP
jgi:hypothetical protein